MIMRPESSFLWLAMRFKTFDILRVIMHLLRVIIHLLRVIIHLLRVINELLHVINIYFYLFYFYLFLLLLILFYLQLGRVVNSFITRSISDVLNLMPSDSFRR